MPRESEADFLTRQTAEARAALRRSSGRAAACARRLLSVRPWTDEYPWATIGVAASAGFLVGAGPIGSHRDPLESGPPPPRRPMLTTLSHVFVLGVLRRLLSDLIRGSQLTRPTPRSF